MAFGLSRYSLWLGRLAGSSMVYILGEDREYAMSLTCFIVISHPPPVEIPLWVI